MKEIQLKCMLTFANNHKEQDVVCLRGGVNLSSLSRKKMSYLPISIECWLILQTE